MLVNGLKAASEIVESMKGLSDIASMQAKVGELQAVILATMEGALASNTRELAQLQKISTLEARVAELESHRSEPLPER